MLRVEQSVPEYNIGSTIFLKFRPDWDHDRFRSFTWSTILKSADPLDAFDRAIGEVIVLGNGSGDKQWFDVSCRRTDAWQTAYHA